MTKRKTDAEFKKQVYDLVGNEYTFLEPYQGAFINIKVKHNKCGNIYEVRPNHFLNNGTRCPQCAVKSQKKTDAQFKKEVKNLVGDEYKFLDSYQDFHTKLRVKHNKCGNIYEVQPCAFLRGSRCSYCFRTLKKTAKQFKQEVKNLVGNEYTFLEPYVNSRTKIKVKHNKCGNIYEVIPNHFLNNGTRCQFCFIRDKTKTDAQFKQEVYNLVGNEYTFLDTYVNNKTKLSVKHNKCGNVYMVTPSSFMRGSRCPFCYGNYKKTDKWFKKEVYDLVGNEYTFLDSYVNSKTKLRVKHNECGKVYEIAPEHFLNDGIRCPCCSGYRKSNARFKQEVYDLVGNEYTFLDSYVNNKTKLRVKHNKCGNTYYVYPINFISHQARCPYCNSRPKGEVIINKILKSLKIKYEYQKTFDDLRDTGLLSYDFYIPDQNILIEYQGRQHYQPVDYFGGDNQFKTQQKHDKMKADYAKDNGYKLIAVPYTEDTLSKIKKYLVKHGLEQHLKSTPKRDAAFYFTFAQS